MFLFFRRYARPSFGPSRQTCCDSSSTTPRRRPVRSGSQHVRVARTIITTSGKCSEPVVIHVRVFLRASCANLMRLTLGGYAPTEVFEHDAPQVEFCRRRMLPVQSADRVLCRVSDSAEASRPIRRGVPVFVVPEVGQKPQDYEKLQFAAVAGSRQHCGQEARHAQTRC